MKHEDYWLYWEDTLPAHFVDLADYDFVIKRSLYDKGISSEPRCRGRKALAEALVQAREQLPKGYNFTIMDCYRSWEEQQLIHQWHKENLNTAHPEWSEECIDKHLHLISPNTRLICRFDKHRYGGAVDLSIVDQDGQELDMGPRFSDGDTEGSRLLYFEFRTCDQNELAAREHRRMLLQAMESAGFDALLHEWWHWGFSRDVDSLSIP